MTHLMFNGLDQKNAKPERTFARPNLEVTPSSTWLFGTGASGEKEELPLRTVENESGPSSSILADKARKK